MTSIEIETERLRLRPLRMADLDSIHRIWNNPGVRKYLWDDEAVSKNLAEATLAESVEHFESEGIGLWGIEMRGGDCLIGFCGFRFFDDSPEVEVLYGLLPEYWKQGLASEATRAMLRYGFEELKLDRIYAGADPPNLASFRVMERVGMRFVRRAEVRGLEAIYYALTREEFVADDSHYALKRDC